MAHHAPAERLHAARGAEPAQDRLVPDPHRHDVVAGDAAVLAPVHRGVPGGEAAVADARVDRDEIADVALAHHLDDGAVEGQGHRRGHDLGDLSGMAARDIEHCLRLDRVHRHAGLAEHVLARLQRRYRERGVHVGPGPDAHRVDVLVVDDLRPVVRMYPRECRRLPPPGARRRASGWRPRRSSTPFRAWSPGMWRRVVFAPAPIRPTLMCCPLMPRGASWRPKRSRSSHARRAGTRGDVARGRDRIMRRGGPAAMARGHRNRVRRLPRRCPRRGRTGGRRRTLARRRWLGAKPHRAW